MGSSDWLASESLEYLHSPPSDHIIVRSDYPATFTKIRSIKLP
jgi:hypothetical protein